MSHELWRQYHVDLPLKLPYDHARRRYELTIVIVRVAEKFKCKSYKCCKVGMLAPDTTSHTVVLLYRK